MKRVFFLNWIKWGDIGSQSHTAFKCTTEQNIVCILQEGVLKLQQC